MTIREIENELAHRVPGVSVGMLDSDCFKIILLFVLEKLEKVEKQGETNGTTEQSQLLCGDAV